MIPPEIQSDELFRVELRIAQRADQLARLHGSDPVHALKHWRQAEREVWRQAIDRELEHPLTDFTEKASCT